MPCANSCRLWLTVPWLGSDISNQANRRLPDYTVSLNRRSSQLQQRPRKINNSLWTVRAEALQSVQAIGLLSNVAYSRGAYFSNFGSSGFIASHGCASEVQISYCGLYKLGSSKVPAAIPCPKSLLPPNNREPQSGQKPRTLSPIISLVVPKYFGVPWVILKAFPGT